MNITSHSPEETCNIAERLVSDAAEDAVFALYGELGSGKTCFVKGIAIALGIRQAVTSPTFTIINEYRGARPLYHIDLYRVQNPDEALALGLEDYLDRPGIVAIEWAERAAGILSDKTTHIYFGPLSDPNHRSIRINASSSLRP